MYFLINSDVDTSNDAVGSSSRSNFGSFNKALHRFTLVFWPEDNVPYILSSKSFINKSSDNFKIFFFSIYYIIKSRIKN